MHRYLAFILLYVLFTLQVEAQKKIYKVTEYERQRINDWATILFDFGSKGFGYNYVHFYKVTKDNLSVKYILNRYKEVLLHPFLEDSLRYKIAIDMFSIANYKKYKFSKNQKYLIAKNYVRYIDNRSERMGPILLRYISNEKYGLQLKGMAKPTFALKKYALPYLYQLLDNPDIIRTPNVRRTWTKYYKKEMAAYIIAYILKEDYRVTIVDDVHDTLDTAKINQKIESFRKKLLLKPRYRKLLLKTPNIKYNKTIERYYDRNGNPTRDASKIVERDD